MQEYKPATKLCTLKNPIFINNSKDPLTGKFVKSIWLHSVYNHGKSEKYDLRWEYYRDRKRTSVETFYKQHKGRKIKMIFSGDPVQYEMEILLIKNVIKVAPLKGSLPIPIEGWNSNNNQENNIEENNIEENNIEENNIEENNIEENNIEENNIEENNIE